MRFFNFLFFHFASVFTSGKPLKNTSETIPKRWSNRLKKRLAFEHRYFSFFSSIWVPWGAQVGAKIAKMVPKSLPKTDPKTSYPSILRPKTPQDPPKTFQDVPKRSQDPPRPPQNVPKSSPTRPQDSPKTPARPPKSILNVSRGRPRPSQERRATLRKGWVFQCRVGKGIPFLFRL